MTTQLTTQLYQNDQGTIVVNGYTVYCTTDYGRFRFDPRNRPINQAHLEKIYDSVVKKNLLREYPILVDSNFTVMDGQHRLKVAEALGVPIYYIISDRAQVEDVAQTNIATKRWELMDYLHYYCKQGNVEYQKLWQFAESYDFLKLGMSIQLCHYGRSNEEPILDTFRAGRYIPNDIPHATKVAKAILDFKPWIKFWKDKAFISTISNLTSNIDYDHARMMQKMEYLSKKLVRCADTDSYIAVINEIYNYKAAPSKVVTLRKLQPNSAKYRADRKSQP